MIKTANTEKISGSVNVSFSITPATREGSRRDGDDAQPPVDKQASLRGIGDQFTTKLLLLWTYMKEIGQVAHATTFTNLTSMIVLILDVIDTAKLQSATLQPLAEVQFILEIGRGGEEKKTLRVTEKIYEHRHLRSLMDAGQFYDAARRILYESAIQQIVNAYERLIGDLLRWQLTWNPDAAPKDQTISYRDLLQFADLAEAKRRVIQNVLTDFIRSKSSSDQLEYFRKEFNADVRSHFPRLDEFSELVLRRHSIVHAGGLVTPEYLRYARSLKALPFDLPTEGTFFKLDQSYVESAWSVVYALGVILFHLLNRQYAKHNNAVEDEESGDTFMNHSAFRAIQQTIFPAAELILNYGSRLRLAKTTTDLMVIINLAQTLKWQGREDEARAVLEKTDWAATNNLFRLSVAALRDPENFPDLLIAAAREKSISLEDIYEWPVFNEIRRDERFSDWVQDAFGCPGSVSNEVFSPALLNFDHEASLTKFLETLTGRNKAAPTPNKTNGAES